MADDIFLGGRTGAAHDALERALRAEPGRVLSVLVRSLGDIDLAEDALQDAAAAALDRWPVEGVPASPGGWLVTVARRRAIDRLRRTAVGRRKEAQWSAARSGDDAPGGAGAPSGSDGPGWPADEPLGDERLALMFACCHPSLSPPSRVALTLRTLGGLSTAEIARAFVVAEPAMKQRITRAKQKIRDAAIPLRIPAPGLLAERLPGVLAVLYLIFNEGYASSAGRGLTRPDLSEEAIRLARLVDAAIPTPETRALVALMLFHHARSAARATTGGALVPLGEQDRTRWDGVGIAEANRLLVEAAAAAGEEAPGPYQLQAAIASVHANAARPEDTRWDDLARLYDGLVAVAPTPVFRLNRSVAYGMTAGPAEALAQIDALDGLDGFHLFHATRADMLRRLDRPAEAVAAYRRALALTTNPAERRHLDRRITECS